MQGVTFSDMHVEAPDLKSAAAAHEELTRAWDAATTPDERLAILQRWDTERREVITWASLARTRFSQDTRDPAAKAERDLCDQLSPKLIEYQIAFTDHLVDGPHRAEVERVLGSHALKLWETRRQAYAPEIEKELIREAELVGEYTKLLASARFDFEGERYTLATLSKFFEHPERQVRYDATKASWGWFTENATALDQLFDELVKLRAGMAQTLGFDNFVSLGYVRMTRTDYDEHDVARYRDAVREHVVPLCEEIRQRQAEMLGLEQLMSWDAPMHDPLGNPKPQGDHDWMVRQASAMFDEMGPELGELFGVLRDRGLMDLQSREGKAGGGYCTRFPHYDVPFIFANFNGTKGDVKVLTHEVGHAFQGYQSRQLFPYEYHSPTMEACEVHSMSLEFLTWPHMEKFFGDDADRFRRLHLTQSLLFLPYGVAIDHFQHEVYRRPEASPAQRKEIWQEMERLYLPDASRYGDIEHPRSGGIWQRQAHVYRSPFYYIDYTLAQVCALQFWVRAEADPKQALADYVALCKLGGSAPFQELLRSAGLRSPFEKGALDEVVTHARSWLDNHENA